VRNSLEDRYERFLREVPSGSTTYDGVTWRWYDQGEGAFALVILPGAVGGTDVFFVLFQELQSHIRVIGLDLPFVEDAAAAVTQMETLLASRGVEHAVFLGASFSGLFVQAFARRHPHRTRALILSHTGALDPSRAEKQRANARFVTRIPLSILRGLLHLVVRLLLRKTDGKRFWIARYDAALAAVTKQSLVSRYLLEASIEELGGPAWTGDVLVIHSGNDAIAKPEQQARLRQQYPGARWVEFKGAGHSSYSRDPLRYSAAVREFVSAVTR
jgi:pimeloyl-ACP methyl ester carboxylesterase